MTLQVFYSLMRVMGSDHIITGDLPPQLEILKAIQRSTGNAILYTREAWFRLNHLLKTRRLDTATNS